jgi:hypothetical protein
MANKVARALGKRRMETMSKKELKDFQSIAGKASAEALTEQERKERARKAAAARWAAKPAKKESAAKKPPKKMKA